MLKTKIKKLVFLIIILSISLYLSSQIIIYAFFPQSRIVRIKTEFTLKDLKKNPEIDWLENRLNVTQYIGTECSTRLFYRYNKNKIEVLNITPNMVCSGFRGNITYTIYYNNIISPFIAYTLELLSINEIIVNYNCSHNSDCKIDGVNLREISDFIYLETDMATKTKEYNF